MFLLFFFVLLLVFVCFACLYFCVCLLFLVCLCLACSCFAFFVVWSYALIGVVVLLCCGASDHLFKGHRFVCVVCYVRGVVVLMLFLVFALLTLDRLVLLLMLC